MITADFQETADKYLVENLKPLVTSIDLDSFYPENVLKEMGKQGFYGRIDASAQDFWSQTLGLIEETGVICGSTAFSLWCHTAAMVYIRSGNSKYLKNEILPQLASGNLLGATGLSNPFKYYAGMETIRLSAKQVSGGFRVSGFLPYVSNLSSEHWFGIIAEVDEKQRVAAFIPATVDGLRISERKDFLGLNGSATYNCHFQGVFVPEKWILDENADSFVERVIDEVVLNQAGIGLGITRASIQSIRGLKDKQGGVNQYLKQQPDELETRLEALRKRAYGLIESKNGADLLKDILRVRLESSYLVLEATNSGMLYAGAGGYVRKSNYSRRLGEAYFVALVTPAVKHLEKLLQDGLV